MNQDAGGRGTAGASFGLLVGLSLGDCRRLLWPRETSAELVGRGGLLAQLVASLDHLGRWRLHEEMGNRNAAALIKIDREGTGYKISQVHGARPFPSADPDSSRIY